jgi:hypothetical protein
VIWEIILRDFWGDILRHLVTPYRRSNANAELGAFESAPLRSVRPRKLPDKKKERWINASGSQTIDLQRDSGPEPCS